MKLPSIYYWPMSPSEEFGVQLSTLGTATASQPRLCPMSPLLLPPRLHKPLQGYHPNLPPQAHIHLLILPYKAFNTQLSAGEPASKVPKQMASLAHETNFYFWPHFAEHKSSGRGLLTASQWNHGVESSRGMLGPPQVPPSSPEARVRSALLTTPVIFQPLAGHSRSSDHRESHASKNWVATAHERLIFRLCLTFSHGFQIPALGSKHPG